MMWTRRRQTEAGLLASERRQREDEAPRLKVEVPELTELAITISEYREQGSGLASQYTRRVVVVHAPALFEIPCTDERCKGGGYDITHEVMHALRSRLPEFEGEAVCAGQVGHGECRRVVRFAATAQYGEPEPGG